ncbi:MAG: MAPEG family protein [Robiginitomaculum sp.]
MENSPLLTPMLVQMGLMIAIAFWLVWARVGSVVRGKVDIKDVAKDGWQGWIKNAGDNYANQYEMPTLFFAICLTFLVTHSVSPIIVTLAWVFVGFRILHALIHVTYNNINHRFLMFLISALVVTALFVKLVMALC